MDDLEAILESLDKEIQQACEVIMMALTGHMSPQLLTDAVVNEVLQAWKHLLEVLLRISPRWNRLDSKFPNQLSWG